MAKREKTLVTKVAQVDGRDIHMLSMSDGSVVSDKAMQDYCLALTIKKNRQVEVNNRMADDKKRQDAQPINDGWKVPSHLNKQFVFDLASGVDYCARKYNTTTKQVKEEARRIAPHILI